MSKRILVAYASGTGSTGEVAEAIGEVLRADGDTVYVTHVDNVRTIGNYSAVVLGSSIRAGRWLPSAIRFLETFVEEMAQRPVAYFTTCLTMVNDTAESRRTVMAYLEPILSLNPNIEPVGLGLFAGSLDPSRLLVMEGISGPHGDYRNWEAIRAWAAEVKPKLLTGEVSAPIKPTNLNSVILSYTDLSRSDLSDVDLRHSDLHKSNLQKTNFSRANLRDTNLAAADLQDANLEGASLHWSNLASSNLHGANLAGANLIGADLKAANLEAADLQNAILNGANLKEASLRSASLRLADLNWADLSAADLSAADLSSANLGWADLSEANLDDTVLDQARYNDQTKWPEDFVPEQAGCVRFV
ncbi:MAG: pentapeptide repeat-containing protein [Anaerolineales bacterium]|nr:pentapeptide repeat-containing protein [Anaerolineales bacterium]